MKNSDFDKAAAALQNRTKEGPVYYCEYIGDKRTVRPGEVCSMLLYMDSIKEARRYLKDDHREVITLRRATREDIEKVRSRK